MKCSSIVLPAVVLMSALTIGACLPGRDGQHRWILSRHSAPVIPGWMYVAFIDPEATSRNRIKLAEFDGEFFGPLFEDGLKIDDTGWLKPAYGNRNLLWTLDSGIGNRRQQAILESREKFSSSLYDFTDGIIEIAEHGWRYAGYTITAGGPGTAAYQSFIFVCSGVSVFYWGDGSSVAPQEDQSVIALLTELSSHCE